MQCMKCGREIPAGDVFCEDCLSDMEKYPVRPGTVVHIPRRPAQPVKRQERRPASVEQRLAVMTRRVQALSFALTLSIALLIAACALAFSMYQEQEEGPPTGQNYSTVDGTSTTGTDITDPR